MYDQGGRRDGHDKFESAFGQPPFDPSLQSMLAMFLVLHFVINTLKYQHSRATIWRLL